MRLNAVYFVNVIDSHLAKLAGLKFSFKDASLNKIVANYENKEATTCGMQRDRLLSIAKAKGDEFAAMFLTGSNWQNDYRAFGRIQDFRNRLAHGGTISQEEVDMANESVPGYDFDADGYFTLSDDMEAAFVKIKTTIVNDVELLAGFRRIELAFGELVAAKGIVFQSSAKYVIRRFISPRKDDVAKSLCRSLWKMNNIRNRYVHTGRITESERAFCERLAETLNTTF